MMFQSQMRRQTFDHMNNYDEEEVMIVSECDPDELNPIQQNPKKASSIEGTNNAKFRSFFNNQSVMTTNFNPLTALDTYDNNIH